MKTIESRLMLATPRQIALTGCAVARTVEHFLTDQRSRDGIEVAERFADGLATEEEIEAAAMDAAEAALDAGEAEKAIKAAAWAVAEGARAAATAADTAAASAAQAAMDAGVREEEINSILDCILFPRNQADFPAQVIGLAATIYEKRDWSLMPILADALEEIELEAFAQHCRQPIHARGCHVVDAIMAGRKVH